MNKNSYFEYQPGKFYNDGTGMITLGCNDMPQKKEKTMNSEYKFHVSYDSFKTLEEATKFARRQTMHSKEDTVIRQDVAVVKFPVPDYEVETLSV